MNFSYCINEVKFQSKILKTSKMHSYGAFESNVPTQNKCLSQGDVYCNPLNLSHDANIGESNIDNNMKCHNHAFNKEGQTTLSVVDGKNKSCDRPSIASLGSDSDNVESLTSKPETSFSCTGTSLNNEVWLKKQRDDLSNGMIDALLKTPHILKIPTESIVFVKVHDKAFDFFCHICRKDFSGKSALTEHMRIHSGEQPFSCELCNKKFNKKGNLMRHMNTHGGEKQHTCGICGKSFSHACTLKDHMRRHTGERPHECHICDKRFAEKCNLKRHLEWHSGIKSHSCNECGKMFYDVGNLSKHLRVHTGERPYECGVCGKRFRYANTLQRHERIHTGEAPFICPVCTKAFFSNAELHNHSVIHTGIKRFKCEQCGKCFKRSHHLQQHLISHTGEKPYKCDVCGSRFVQTSGLRKHMKTFHPTHVTDWQELPIVISDVSEDIISQNVQHLVEENLKTIPSSDEHMIIIENNDEMICQP